MWPQEIVDMCTTSRSIYDVISESVFPYLKKISITGHYLYHGKVYEPGGDIYDYHRVGASVVMRGGPNEDSISFGKYYIPSPVYEVLLTDTSVVFKIQPYSYIDSYDTYYLQRIHDSYRFHFRQYHGHGEIFSESSPTVAAIRMTVNLDITPINSMIYTYQPVNFTVERRRVIYEITSYARISLVDFIKDHPMVLHYDMIWIGDIIYFVSYIQQDDEYVSHVGITTIFGES